MVEDDPVLREELAFQLGHAGFAVETFSDAPALYRRLAVRRFALLLLDIGLEGEDGLAICRHLRTHDAQLGILFVTARALRDERLAGLEAGADAYLTKPIDLAELLLVLRRLAERVRPPRADALTGTAANDWRHDSAAAELIAPNGQRLRLSANETQLLSALLRQRGRVLPHDELAVALALLAEDNARHRIEVIISRLRARVRRETGLALPVRAQRGLGYLFAADDLETDHVASAVLKADF
jgi:DNA-binding response OmpR family regulator